MVKKIFSVLLGSLMLFASTGFTHVGQVKAEEVTQQKHKLSESELAELKDKLSDLGINEVTQEKLIEKYENGQPWDSMNPAKLKKQAPSFQISSKNPVQRYTFEDGSVLQLKVTVLKEETISSDQAANLMAKKKDPKPECGTGYCKFYNVLIDGSSGVQSAEFKADFVLVQQGYDYISEIYDWSIVTIGGYYSKDEFEINRPKETKNRDAQATLRWTAIAVGGAGSGTSYLKLNVGDDTWSIDGSM
ncbi:hypothetical protein [Brevibacillus brevis]|uniref:hypothetical protein n=1 Tax=Brevibacillus brevis TaxID=1393 RepID=UPI0011599D05|nr:hypothetical protein [Lysinibacillus sp. SDF0063]TQR38518.1 hypothetical protein C7Y45_00150 [Lysinibacillus sp. SDF0063]